MQYLTFSLLFAFFVLQLLTIKKELTSSYFVRGRSTGEDWFIHHDEKIALSDARYLYLRKKGDIDLWDFLPQPVSVAFGVMYPILIFWGFKLFGLNNFGLRFFNLLITTVTNILIVLIFFNSIPATAAFLFCILFLFNWNYFILTRHAVIENALTLYFATILYLYLCHSEFFMANIFFISFIASSIVFFKINFPLYGLILILSVAGWESFSALIYVFSGFVLGTCLFESIQLVLLNRYKVAKWRIGNLLIVLKVHGGKQKSMGVKLRPMGLRVFYSSINLFIEWFGIKKDIIDINNSRPFVVITFISVFLISLYLSFRFNPVSISLWLFLFLFLLSLTPFHFYMKRVLSIFPILLILSAFMFQGVLSIYPEIETLLQTILLVCVTFMIYRQIKNANDMLKKESNLIQEFSHDVENLIPHRERIYSHCYGFRFLWMVKKHRFRFADDNAMNNQEIIDWAIKDNARYVIITSGGGKINSLTLPFLKIIKVYTTTPSDSDIPEGLLICKLNL